MQTMLWCTKKKKRIKGKQTGKNLKKVRAKIYSCMHTFTATTTIKKTEQKKQAQQQ